MLVDSYKHKGLRMALVRQLRARNCFDERVMQAMEKLPRHWFLPNNTALERILYEDRAFHIGNGQTISHPSTVACQSTLLDVQEGEKVLEIGTGSGYQAAVLKELGAKVYSIERQKDLHDKTKELLAQLGYSSIKTFFGDGFAGLPTFAPFDKVLITCAAPEIPEALVKQLKPGGFFVLPLTNEENNQTMLRLSKHEDGTLSREEFGTFAFVPMLKGKSY